MREFVFHLEYRVLTVRPQTLVPLSAVLLMSRVGTEAQIAKLGGGKFDWPDTR